MVLGKHHTWSGIGILILLTSTTVYAFGDWGWAEQKNRRRQPAREFEPESQYHSQQQSQSRREKQNQPRVRLPEPEAEENEEPTPPQQQSRRTPQVQGSESEVSPSASRRGPASTEGGKCQNRQLKFSADRFPAIPARGTPSIWGGNANGGSAQLYSSAFLTKVKEAKLAGHQTFAYLEGPCGDTAGKDKDGEKARCAKTFSAFNKRNAPGTPNTSLARWEPFTFQQLKASGKNQIDHCEIDNLNNNVKVPMIPFLTKYKKLYDSGEIHCKLVLKNISAREIASYKSTFSSQARGVDFISPFHIFEAYSFSQRDSLNSAMRSLKGAGAVTIISASPGNRDAATNNYGSYFAKETVRTCDGRTPAPAQANTNRPPSGIKAPARGIASVAPESRK